MLSHTNVRAVGICVALLPILVHVGKFARITHRGNAPILLSAVSPNSYPLLNPTLSNSDKDSSENNTASGTPIPPPQATGYKLRFSDDFSTSSLGPKGAAYNWYNISAIPNGVSVSSSTLNLNVPLPNSGYSSAVASNAGWQFGYVEIRAQWMAGTKGSWPALWMIPMGSNPTFGAAGSYSNRGGEIDIMEGNGGFQPNQYWGTVHYWVNNTDTWNNEAKSANVYTVPAGVDLTQYHTYGVMWKPGSITWYFDNRPVVSTTGYPSGIDAASYYLILAQQVGINGTYACLREVKASNLGLNVDWVRVWQKG